MIDTFGTNAVPEADIMAAVDATFDLRPGAIIDALDLRRPIYRLTARLRPLRPRASRVHVGAHRQGRRAA